MKLTLGARDLRSDARAIGLQITKSLSPLQKRIVCGDWLLEVVLNALSTIQPQKSDDNAQGACSLHLKNSIKNAESVSKIPPSD